MYQSPALLNKSQRLMGTSGRVTTVHRAPVAHHVLVPVLLCLSRRRRSWTLHRWLSPLDARVLWKRSLWCPGASWHPLTVNTHLITELVSITLYLGHCCPLMTAECKFNAVLTPSPHVLMSTLPWIVPTPVTCPPLDLTSIRCPWGTKDNSKKT